MYIESFFVWGNLDTIVELEVPLVASVVSIRIIGNGVSQNEYLSTQLILQIVVSILFYMLMI